MHVVNNTASPAGNMLGHVRSSLKVLSAADIMDVSVILQVQHPDVAALEVSVWREQALFEGCCTIPLRDCACVWGLSLSVKAQDQDLIYLWPCPTTCADCAPCR